MMAGLSDSEKNQNSKEKNRQTKAAISRYDIISLAVCILFYMAFCFVFGVTLCADSEGYIGMISAREPVYPIFLWIFRNIFGEANYLFVIVFIQNLLMAFAVWLSSTYIKNRFQFREYVVYPLLLVHFGVAFLCQFAAGRASAYPNSILTEGIAISLWIIFMYFLWRAVLDYDLKYVIFGLILAAFMMDTRKQMAVAYIDMFGCCLVAWFGRKDYFKKMALVLVMTVCSIALAIGGTRLYNLVLRGEFSQNTRDMNLILTTSLYIADEEDYELIDDEDARQLFRETYRVLDKKKCILKYAPDDLKGLEAHYEDSFDKITIDTTAYSFVEFAEKKGFAKGLMAEQEADRLSSVIVSSLLKDNLGHYAKVYSASLLNGFINTVAKRSRILDLYGILAFLIYLVLMIICLAGKKTREAGLVAFCVLAGVIVNVGVTAALIFCQTRYMIYNMALFYCAGMLLVAAFIKNKVLSRRTSENTK